MQNNILVTDNFSKINGVGGTSTNLTYTNNLHFGGIGTDVAGTSAVKSGPPV